MEKLYLRLEHHLAGIDHLNALDREKFAVLHSLVDRHAESLEIPLINDFYVYEGDYGHETENWHQASRGLLTFRTMLDFFQQSPNSVPQSYQGWVYSMMETVIQILDEADLRDVRFCFVGDY